MANQKRAAKSPIPHKQSDHDERLEQPATDVAWDSKDMTHDASMDAGRHANQFKQDGVALSDEDWDEEEGKDDEIPDHVSKTVDASLEALAEEEEAENGEEEE